MNDLVPPDFVKEEVWESWKKSWEDPKNKEKAAKNAKNHRAGGDVAEAAPGTHTGGSITIDEHRRRYILKYGKEPTPSELHAYVHTHGNDGQNFVGSKPKQVNDRYVDIVEEQRQPGSEVDELQAYFKAVGGEKKRRVYGLGDAAGHYYGDIIRGTSTSDHASSSSKNSQPSSTPDLAELVRQMMPALKTQFLPRGEGAPEEGGDGGGEGGAEDRAEGGDASITSTQQQQPPAVISDNSSVAPPTAADNDKIDENQPVGGRIYASPP